MHFSRIFADPRLNTRPSTKGAVHSYFRKVLWKNYFEKVLLTNFISIWKNSRKYCIFADFLLIVSYVQIVLPKELLIAPFVEHFSITTLGKSLWQALLILWRKCWSIAFCWLSAFSILYTRNPIKVARSWLLLLS